MKSTIELKHVGPRQHVQGIIEELIARVEEKLQHFRSQEVSIHVVFEENGSHKLFRTSLTCHIPRCVVAAHEEHRESGVSIRHAFAELERQLERHLSRYRPQGLRRRLQRTEQRVKRLSARPQRSDVVEMS